MKKCATVILILLLSITGIVAAERSLTDPGSAVEPFIKGYYVRITEEGDTILVFALREFTVFEKIKFKDNKEKENYNRLARNVKITLPYAKMICETMIETYEYIETLPTQKEREQYLKRMEGAIFNQYKPVLKRFSKNQAKVLIKLIQRETSQSSYQILKAFLGSGRAAFWQGFGKLFGVNLKAKYEPRKNKEDAYIERIVCQVEQGIY